MDTLALALALMMDGRAPAMSANVQTTTYRGASRDSVALVAPERVAALETRKAVAVGKVNVWDVR